MTVLRKDSANHEQLAANGVQPNLIPRLPSQGYAPELVAERRKWIEEQLHVDLPLVGECGIETESMRGNVENPIGSIQMPLGIAGPLAVNGKHAEGVFYVPLATTEGALVRSYERGMVAITRAGGAVARVIKSENRSAPIFVCRDIESALEVCEFIERTREQICAEAEATTSHGKLQTIRPRVVGRDVIVTLGFYTADAHGMNMIAKAAERACRWIASQCSVERWYMMSGASSEKRTTAGLLFGGKGQYVTASVEMSKRTCNRYLHANPERLVDLWRRTIVAQSFSGCVGHNAHYANGLTALFIATGQDVANVVNSAVGMTHYELLANGSLHASITLPSVTLATVGGGTHMGTSAECLRLLGCLGTGGVKKFAEVVAATLLAGELSFAAALASGEFVEAHEEYGRNRPTVESNHA